MDNLTAVTFLLLLFSALVGFAMWFAVVYAAIRLALKHDRRNQVRDAALTKAVAARHTDEMRVYAAASDPQNIEQIRQATRPSRDAAEARRVAEKAARAT
jgi:hypothetical protein